MEFDHNEIFLVCYLKDPETKKQKSLVSDFKYS